jgi:hypothetical protein
MALFHDSFNLAAKTFSGKGTCLEFGVGWGDTYSYQIKQIIQNYPGLNLIGFDSWQGLPKETEGVWYPERHAEKQLAFPKEAILNMIPPGDGRFKLVDGFFINSLTPELQATIDNVIFINMDVDIHSSTLQVLNFVGPLLQPGTIIYWDDWKDPNDNNPMPWGEHLAWEEWYYSQSDIVAEELEVNRVNQRSMLIIKTKKGELSHQQCVRIRRMELKE